MWASRALSRICNPEILSVFVIAEALERQWRGGDPFRDTEEANKPIDQSAVISPLVATAHALTRLVTVEQSDIGIAWASPHRVLGHDCRAVRFGGWIQTHQRRQPPQKLFTQNFNRGSPQTAHQGTCFEVGRRGPLANDPNVPLASSTCHSAICGRSPITGISVASWLREQYTVQHTPC